MTDSQPLTTPQMELTKRVLAQLLAEYGTQASVADKLGTTAATVSRAHKLGRTGIATLLRACALAKTPKEEMAEAGIVVADCVTSRDDAVRMFAEDEGIPVEAVDAFFRMRASAGLGQIKLSDALAMIRMIARTGSPFTPVYATVEENDRAVEKLFERTPVPPAAAPKRLK